MSPERPESTPLSAEDLSFWYTDQPRQRTTMAMLMLLDRRPDPERLRAAVWRMVESVPRMRQRVVDAPFDLARPRWETDATFDLDFHLRRYALPDLLAGESELEALFHAVGPIYERPFDRTRPLWELIEIDRPHERSAVFFRLHHAVADGVGGNAILAALTDAGADGVPLAPPPEKPPGAWPEPGLGRTLARALRDRVAQDVASARAVTGALWNGIVRPQELLRAGRIVAALVEDLRHTSESPLRDFGRARRLTGFDVPFAPLRAARRELGGSMIDLLLTAVAGATGAWLREQGLGRVAELQTLVPINLRARDAQGMEAGVGNRATGILVRLPVCIASPRRRFREIHRRVEERKAHPAMGFFPIVTDVLATLPRALYRTIAHRSSQAIDLIVTNVPGIPVPRWIAGAEIEAAYPFAPTAPHCPVSIALYGHRDRLFVGLDADATSMPALETYRDLLARSLDEVVAAAQR